MEPRYLTLTYLLGFILFGGIEESTGARLGDLKKRSSTSVIPHHEEIQAALIEKLPLLTTIMSAQYEGHCRKRGIQVKSEEIDAELNVCIGEPTLRFVENIFATMESSPPHVVELTTSAGMKLYSRTVEEKFYALSAAEQNAVQTQVVGPICAFAVDILHCFQREIRKGKLKCTNWYEKKLLEYATHQLRSLCFNNGSRIIQFLNVDLRQSECIQGNKNFDYGACYKKRGLQDEEPKTLEEFCRIMEILSDHCGGEVLADCKEKDIMDIATPMLRESQMWAKTECLRDTPSSAKRIHEFPVRTGLIFTTILNAKF